MSLKLKWTHLEDKDGKVQSSHFKSNLVPANVGLKYRFMEDYNILLDFLLNIHSKQPRSCWDVKLS